MTDERGGLDLEGANPNDLVFVDLSVLLRAAQGIENWTPRLAQNIDYAYRYRLVILLVQRAPVEDLVVFHASIRQVATLISRAEDDGKIGDGWATRWRAFADVIDARIANLRTQTPQRVLERTHVSEILHAIRTRQEGIPQSELRALLGISKSNLSRVLNLMEANELIKRSILGRENLIQLSNNASLTTSWTPEPTLEPEHDGVFNRLHFKNASMLS